MHKKLNLNINGGNKVSKKLTYEEKADKLAEMLARDRKITQGGLAEIIGCSQSELCSAIHWRRYETILDKGLKILRKRK